MKGKSKEIPFTIDYDIRCHPGYKNAWYFYGVMHMEDGYSYEWGRLCDPKMDVTDVVHESQKLCETSARRLLIEREYINKTDEVKFTWKTK